MTSSRAEKSSFYAALQAAEKNGSGKGGTASNFATPAIRLSL
jgi:hypothetical protein